MKTNGSCCGPLAADLGLLAMRLMLATVFLFHGSQKLFGAFGGSGIEGFAGWLGTIGIPLPTISAWLAAGSEFFGGLALLLGVAQCLLSIPLCFTMLVAAFGAHSGFSGQSGMEYPLTLAIMVLGLGLTGPGRFVLPVGKSCR